MLRILFPREESFFKLFQQAADILLETTHEFYNLLSDLNHLDDHVIKIAVLEDKADEIALSIFELLHKTFITPFDRHDIHALTTTMDDTIDRLNRFAQRLPFYNLKEIPGEMVTLSLLSIKCAELLKEAVYALHSLKNSSKIVKFCTDLDRLEAHAHEAVISGEKKLFTDEQDFKKFYMMTEIYTGIKGVINSCQDVSNIVKGIVLEYS